jgi:hypothetical protein
MPKSDRVNLAMCEVIAVRETFNSLDVLGEVKQQLAALDRTDIKSGNFIVVSRRVAHLQDPHERGMRVTVFREPPQEDPAV